MRTTSVKPAVGLDDGRVIVFPRQRTIGNPASKSNPSLSKGKTHRKADPGFGQMGGLAGVLDRRKTGRPMISRTDADVEPRDFEIQNGLVQQLQVANLPAHVTAMMRTGMDQPMAGSQMFPNHCPSVNRLPLNANGNREKASTPRSGGSETAQTGSDLAGLTGTSQSGAVRSYVTRINPAKPPLAVANSVAACPEDLRKAAAARFVAVSNRPEAAANGPQGVETIMHERSGQDMSKPDTHAQEGVNPSSQTAEISHYIAQMTQELAQMARSSRLDLLAYFLEMAELEARMRTSATTPQV